MASASGASASRRRTKLRRRGDCRAISGEMSRSCSAVIQPALACVMTCRRRGAGNILKGVAAPQLHTVGGVAKTSRMIGFDCETPLTVYANVPELTSAKVNVAEPTRVTTTIDGFHGFALN